MTSSTKTVNVRHQRGALGAGTTNLLDPSFSQPTLDRHARQVARRLLEGGYSMTLRDVTQSVAPAGRESLDFQAMIAREVEMMEDGTFPELLFWSTGGSEGALGTYTITATWVVTAPDGRSAEYDLAFSREVGRKRWNRVRRNRTLMYDLTPKLIEQLEEQAYDLLEEEKITGTSIEAVIEHVAR